jgi:adenylyltransferase/sulfurtransferase
MALTEAQIDRFSRQIILPQIGGAGQERLLRSSVAVAGAGDLADLVALSLGGAGIGRIALHGAERGRLSRELVDLDPEAEVTVSTGALGSAAADVLVACDVAVDALDCAAASGWPLVAGGAHGQGGWMIVSEGHDVCASCAARAAGRAGIDARSVVDDQALHPDAPRPSPLASSTTGVIASLMALAVLKLRLGVDGPRRRVWWRFDGGHSTLTEEALERSADCPVCAET